MASHWCYIKKHFRKKINTDSTQTDSNGNEVVSSHTFCEDTLSLIPKLTKISEENYRPVSFINIEIKLLKNTNIKSKRTLKRL
jgi:hypothetical protein